MQTIMIAQSKQKGKYSENQQNIKDSTNFLDVQGELKNVTFKKKGAVRKTVILFYAMSRNMIGPGPGWGKL